MRQLRGFTLIELMITVAIVAILAAIAIPSYSEYVMRARISEAIATLGDQRIKMEQYYQDLRSYVGACGAPGSSVAPLPPASAHFTFACAPAPGLLTYTVTATGVAGGTMAGFQYSIDAAGTKTTMSLPAGWTNGACGWTLKKDGTC